MTMYKDIYSNIYYGYSPELYHHGVKGQKHGHRRWQNPDGSLTPAGREHYGVGMKRAKRLAGVGMVTAGAGMVNAGLLAAKKASTAKEIKNLGKATTVVSEAEKIGGTPNAYAAAKIWTAGRAAELTRELLALPALSSPAVVAPIAIGGATALAGLGYIGYKKYQQYKASKGTSVKHCDLSEFDEDTLCHFGIPGQKWGKRRWQNPDGSLTPEGRIHYGVKGTRSSRKIEEKAKAGGYETQEQGERKIRENFERDGFKADIEYDTRPWVNKGKPYVNAWIEKKVNNKSTGNVSISLHTNDYSKQNADKLIDDAKKIEKILPKINKVATDHINEYYKKEKLDRDWNNGKDPSSITKDLLSSISVHDDGTIEVWYNDGNKFRGDYYGGHSISVEYDLKDLLNNDKPKYMYAPSLNG